MSALSSRSKGENLSAENKLRITEIFYSLQGESVSIGIPTVFIRLTGCPLRCHYCDTAYAFSGGQWYSLDQVFAQLAQFQTRFITVTGGEPLAQKSCIALLTQLCDLGYQVSLETSGALDLSEVDPRVSKVMDVKTPSSGEVSKNRYENFALLHRQDQVKFVIGNHEDYQWASKQLQRHSLSERCEVLFSPVHDQMPARELADWILTDQLPVRFQIQLHKYLWGNVAGR